MPTLREVGENIVLLFITILRSQRHILLVWYLVLFEFSPHDKIKQLHIIIIVSNTVLYLYVS